MKAYSFFAKVYDVFMNDIPYVDWLDGIEAYMERRNIQCHRVLELGCGTGRFTALLAADGYEVTGLDLSEAMIKAPKVAPIAAGRPKPIVPNPPLVTILSFLVNLK